jgi:hypothetical protein
LCPWSGGRRHPRRCGARPGALAGGVGALPRGARTCGGPNRPAEGSVRSTTRAGTFCPSCEDSSRRPWSGRSTSPAVRSVPRSARGRRGGVAKGRPQGARSCGGPNRRAERLCPPVGVGTLVNAGRGFHVQHSLNVPALVGTASSDVRMFPAQRAPRSGPRRAPGGNTPHPVTSA